VQTVLYAEAGELRTWSHRERDSFMAEVEWLAVRHSGSVDHYLDRAAVVFFDEPGPCLRMAMDLQRSANDLHLRMGIHTGNCVIGAFRSGGEHRCTLIGAETGLAAQVAMTAATGSIAVSPVTYALVKDDVQADSAGCLVMEEFNERDLAQVWLTPTPVQGGPDLSTFAGLGRL